jgi:hypothetical protein
LKTGGLGKENLPLIPHPLKTTLKGKIMRERGGEVVDSLKEEVPKDGRPFDLVRLMFSDDN